MSGLWTDWYIYVLLIGVLLLVIFDVWGQRRWRAVWTEYVLGFFGLKIYQDGVCIEVRSDSEYL